MLTIKQKVFIVTVILFSITILAVGRMWLTISKELPLINGVIIPNSNPLKDFAVLNHRNQKFTNQDLLGKWHLLSYGYTNCPDVCPMTLTVLAQLAKHLKSEKEFSELGILFYSIDHQRDTVERLEEYLPFFDDNFLGLTYRDEMKTSAQAFEKGLGMISVLTPVEDIQETEIYGSYRVSHGFMLYLINPDGELQAVFRPTKGKAGENFFTEEKIYDDYISIRKYFG